MKNLRISLTAVAILFAATAAQAQQTKVVADVPFNFVVGDRGYPAGQYLLSGQHAMVRIENTAAESTTTVLSNACEDAKPAEKTKLVFHRMGGTYFLYQIWVAGRDYGREFPRSQTEIHLAQNHQKGDEVIVAANLVK